MSETTASAEKKTASESKRGKVKRYIYLTEENHELCSKIADSLGMKIHELEGMIFSQGMESKRFKDFLKLAEL